MDDGTVEPAAIWRLAAQMLFDSGGEAEISLEAVY
jgi:hypothetical protein